MTIALYPGTFDPPHLGHVDVIRRAAPLFGTLWVAVLKNPQKSPLFSVDERLGMLQEVARDFRNVQVRAFDGLTVDLAREVGARVILRGLRAILDYDYEVQMALMNRQLTPEVETLFMLTASRYSHLSSTLVKQIAALGADLDGMVPSQVAGALRRTVGRGR